MLLDLVKNHKIQHPRNSTNPSQTKVKKIHTRCTSIKCAKMCGKILREPDRRLSRGTKRDNRLYVRNHESQEIDGGPLFLGC